MLEIKMLKVLEKEKKKMMSTLMKKRCWMLLKDVSLE
jgi:hypothetical protein